MTVFQRGDHLQALRRVPLFSGLDSRHLDQVARLTTELTEPPGRELTSQGHFGRELIIILEGTARVDKDGKEVGHVGPGNFVGELSLLDGKPRTATITTETSCTVLVVEPRALWALIDTVPELGRAMMLSLCHRLREAYDSLSH